MKMLTTIKHESLTILPPTLFFFVSFCPLIMTNQLISREYRIPAVGFVNAVIGALIVGTAVLIMDQFRVINRFPGKPLIYNVVWTTGLYFAATLLFRYLEHLVRFLSRFGNIAEAHRHVVESIVWPHFWLAKCGCWYRCSCIARLESWFGRSGNGSLPLCFSACPTR